MSSSGMSIAQHVDELRIRLIHIIICIVIITIFSMSFGIKTAVVPIALPSSDGSQLYFLKLYYPYPDPLDNIALQLTSFMKDTLLPSEVKFIQTAPGQVFFAQVYISLLIGLICSLPIVIREIFGFISPAFVQIKRKGESGDDDVQNNINNNLKQTKKENARSSSSLSKIKIIKIAFTSISFVYFWCSILISTCNSIYPQFSIQLW